MAARLRAGANADAAYSTTWAASSSLKSSPQPTSSKSKSSLLSSSQSSPSALATLVLGSASRIAAERPPAKASLFSPKAARAALLFSLSSPTSSTQVECSLSRLFFSVLSAPGRQAVEVRVQLVLCKRHSCQWLGQEGERERKREKDSSAQVFAIRRERSLSPVILQVTHWHSHCTPSPSLSSPRIELSCRANAHWPPLLRNFSPCDRLLTHLTKTHIHTQNRSNGCTVTPRQLHWATCKCVMSV